MKKIILTSLILVLALITIFIYTVFTSNTEKTVVQQTIRRTNSDDTTKVTTSGPNFEKSTGGSISSFFGPNKEEENEVKRNPLNFLLYANKDNESNKLDTGTNSETIFSFRSSSDQDSQTSEPQAQTSQTYSNQNQYQPGDEFIYSEDYDQQNFLSGLDDIYNNSSEWVDEYNEFDDVDYGFIEYDTPTTTSTTGGSTTATTSTSNESGAVDGQCRKGLRYNNASVPWVTEGYWPIGGPSKIEGHMCFKGDFVFKSKQQKYTPEYVGPGQHEGPGSYQYSCKGVNGGKTVSCSYPYYKNLPTGETCGSSVIASKYKPGDLVLTTEACLAESSPGNPNDFSGMMHPSNPGWSRNDPTQGIVWYGNPKMEAAVYHWRCGLKLCSVDFGPGALFK